MLLTTHPEHWPELGTDIQQLMEVPALPLRQGGGGGGGGGGVV